MKIEFLRQSYGDYGANGAAVLVHAGWVLDVPDGTADQLMARGIAKKYREPSILTKMLAPCENKAVVPEDNKTASKPLIPHRFRRKG